MKVYVFIKDLSITHGHGSCGTDKVVPIYDSYTGEYLNYPVFKTFNGAEKYLENLGFPKSSFLTIKELELV